MSFITTTFENQIMSEIDSINAINKIRAINLGGVAGVSGGGGTPPGGFIGQLPQKYVTFDTQELTTSGIPPSGMSLVHNLNRIRSGVALGNDSIVQRHIASGVGTIVITDGDALFEQVKRVKFHNSILTGSDEDAEVEIIAVTSGYYSLPDMTGNNGKYLTNNGSVPSWGVPPGQVTSVFGRTGVVIAVSGDYNWSQINKTFSSIGDITDRGHSNLTGIGTNTHAQIDTHIADTDVHVPSFITTPGAILGNDGLDPIWIYPSGYGHIIESGLGSIFPQRTYLKFTGSVTITDNPSEDSTDLSVSASGSLDYATKSEANAGVITTKPVNPYDLPIRVENGALIHNADYGGDARGANAVDLQSLRGASTNVASGTASALIAGDSNIASGTNSSVLGGDSNEASQLDSAVVGGNGNVAGGSRSVILGGIGNATNPDTVAGGAEYSGILAGGYNLIHENADYGATLGGLQADVINYAQVSNASGMFTSEGDAQGTIQMVLRNSHDFSGGAGWVDTFLNGSSIQIAMPDDAVWTVHILVAMKDPNTQDAASYILTGALKYTGGTLSILAQSKTAIYEDIADWDCQIATDGTTWNVQFDDVAEASEIMCVATVRTAEVY